MTPTETQAKKQLLAHIDTLRKARGWSQEQLGAAIGIGQGAVSAIERGENTPSAETFIRLGDAALAVSISDALWFWERAGFGQDSLLRAADLLFESRGVAPKSGEITRVPVLSEKEGSLVDTGKLVPLPSAYIPKKATARCLRITSAVARYGLKIDDLAVLDVGSQPYKSLWGEVVLAHFMSRSEWRERGYNWDLAWPEGLCIARLSLERYENGFQAELHPLGMLDPLRLGIGYLPRKSGGSFGQGHHFEWEEAKEQMRLLTVCKIKARVIGWLRSPEEWKPKK